MSLNVPATQAYFRNLRCAYTGKPVTVLAVSAGHTSPIYFSPDAFDPSEFYQKPEDLFAALSIRDGVVNAARHGKELVCPYTGAEMTINFVKGFGYQAIGGFCPSEPDTDPVIFARSMMMRGGKVPKDAPKHAPPPKARSLEVTEPAAPKPTLSDDVAAKAENILRDLAPKKTTVPVRGMKGG
jgi:hypothetical protein